MAEKTSGVWNGSADSTAVTVATSVRGAFAAHVRRRNRAAAEALRCVRAHQPVGVSEGIRGWRATTGGSDDV